MCAVIAACTTAGRKGQRPPLERKCCQVSYRYGVGKGLGCILDVMPIYSLLSKLGLFQFNDGGFY